MRFEAVLGRDAERSVNLVDNVKKITRTTWHAKRESEDRKAISISLRLFNTLWEIREVDSHCTTSLRGGFLYTRWIDCYAISSASTTRGYATKEREEKQKRWMENCIKIQMHFKVTFWLSDYTSIRRGLVPWKKGTEKFPFLLSFVLFFRRGVGGWVWVDVNLPAEHVW